MKRRHFLCASVSAGFSTSFAVPIESTAPQAGKDQKLVGQEHLYQKTFRAFIDTLLPRDQFSKSGSELGVDKEIITVALNQDDYLVLIQRGCAWLNAAAKHEGNRFGEFAALAEPARVKILQVAENLGEGKAGPARFLKTVLRHANTIYYSKPAVWVSLGYQGPPQPHGFIDFDEAPNSRPR